MSPAPFTISLRATLEEAESILVEKHITAAPVLDQKGQIAGVLTDYNLVKMFLRRASLKSANSSGFNLLFFHDELDPVVTINENEPITNAFKLIIQSPNHRVFAVSAEGGLSGALSPKDIIPFLAGDTAKPKKFFDEITQAQKKIEELLAQLETAHTASRDYEDFFENAPFMMHAVDFKGNIVMANKMAHVVLGFEPKELIGLSLSTLYPYQLQNQVRESLYLIKSTGYNPLVSSMMVRKDTSLIKVDIASMLRRDSKGTPLSTVTVSRPTEHVNMLDYLRMASKT